MLLKNKITGMIGNFANYQGDDWEGVPEKESKTFLDQRKKDELKLQLIFSRQKYLESTRDEAIDCILSGLEYPNKENRVRATKEIKDIKSTNSLSILNQFSSEFI